jgi:hypothetical protein
MHRSILPSRLFAHNLRQSSQFQEKRKIYRELSILNLKKEIEERFMAGGRAVVGRRQREREKEWTELARRRRYGRMAGMKGAPLLKCVEFNG